LAAQGHQVVAMTRTPEKQAMLAALGATPVVADALDADAVMRAVAGAAPTHVVPELTALPKHGPKRTADLEATNRLRAEGTRPLLAAAIATGATRIVGGSFALLDDTKELPRGMSEAAAATRSMERQILDASRRGAIAGIVLRYGAFYGPNNPMTEDLLDRIRRGRLFTIRGDQGLLPFIHLDDAVSATIAALDGGRPGTAYDIVDDRAVSFSEMVTPAAALLRVPAPRAVPMWVPRLLMPYFARMLSVRLPLSNARARAELEWMPRYPTIRDGLARTLAQAA